MKVLNDQREKERESGEGGKEKRMSRLAVEYLLGVKSLSSACLFYVDDRSYLYPSSRHLIVYDDTSRSQQVVALSNDSDRLTCFAISPKKDALIFAVKTSDQCRLILLEISDRMKIGSGKRKIFSFPSSSMRCKEILSIKFSVNSKALLVLW